MTGKTFGHGWKTKKPSLCGKALIILSYKTIKAYPAAGGAS